MEKSVYMVPFNVVVAAVIVMVDTVVEVTRRKKCLVFMIITKGFGI